MPNENAAEPFSQWDIHRIRTGFPEPESFKHQIIMNKSKVGQNLPKPIRIPDAFRSNRLSLSSLLCDLSDITRFRTLSFWEDAA
jgi:hypothetical protein